MLSLRFYLEKMKNSLDVLSKTYLINDNGDFYISNNNIVPSLLQRVNIYNIHQCIGKTVYLQYEGARSSDNPPNFKTYYQTKIVDIIHYQGNDYLKFNNISNEIIKEENQLYPNSNNPFEFCYMRIITVPLVMMFYS
jgi:hypothetical protein